MLERTRISSESGSGRNFGHKQLNRKHLPVPAVYESNLTSCSVTSIPTSFDGQVPSPVARGILLFDPSVR